MSGRRLLHLARHFKRLSPNARPLGLYHQHQRSSTSNSSFFLSPNSATTVCRRPMTSTTDEVSNARMAAAKKMEEEADAGGITIFDKIARKEIPSNLIYEDDKCVAFHDLGPQAPVHFLVIPKDRAGLSRLSKATPEHKELLGHLLYVAQTVAKEQGLTPDGFRVVINDGPNGSQSVYHLHLHVIGGRQMGWPPGWTFEG